MRTTTTERKTIGMQRRIDDDVENDRENVDEDGYDDDDEGIPTNQPEASSDKKREREGF